MGYTSQYAQDMMGGGSSKKANRSAKNAISKDSVLGQRKEIAKSRLNPKDESASTYQAKKVSSNRLKK